MVSELLQHIFLGLDLGHFWWAPYVFFGGKLESVFGAINTTFEKNIKSSWSGIIVEAQGYFLKGQRKQPRELSIHP